MGVVHLHRLPVVVRCKTRGSMRCVSPSLLLAPVVPSHPHPMAPTSRLGPLTSHLLSLSEPDAERIMLGWTACHEDSAQHMREVAPRSRVVEAQEHAVGAEDVASVAEELNLVQVGGQVVGRLVLLPRGAAVLGPKDRAAAAHSWREARRAGWEPPRKEDLCAARVGMRI